MPDDKPIRMFVADCPIRKNGFPVVGTFGSRVSPVVIFTVSEWQRLCAEVPALATKHFEVGTQD